MRVIFIFKHLERLNFKKDQFKFKFSDQENFSLSIIISDALIYSLNSYFSSDEKYFHGFSFFEMYCIFCLVNIREDSPSCSKTKTRERRQVYLVALDASGGELVLVARGAINLLLPRNEALRTDRILADHAAEALLVPLSGLVLHLLRTCERERHPKFYTCQTLHRNDRENDFTCSWNNNHSQRRRGEIS